MFCSAARVQMWRSSGLDQPSPWTGRPQMTSLPLPLRHWPYTGARRILSFPAVVRYVFQIIITHNQFYSVESSHKTQILDFSIVSTLGWHWPANYLYNFILSVNRIPSVGRHKQFLGCSSRLSTTRWTCRWREISTDIKSVWQPRSLPRSPVIGWFQLEFPGPTVSTTLTDVSIIKLRWKCCYEQKRDWHGPSLVSS